MLTPKAPGSTVLGVARADPNPLAHLPSYTEIELTTQETSEAVW